MFHLLPSTSIKFTIKNVFIRETDGIFLLLHQPWPNELIRVSAVVNKVKLIRRAILLSD